MQIIDAYIDAQGGVKLEVSGVKGSGCQQLTRPIEQALGSVVETETKPEMYETETQHLRQQS